MSRCYALITCAASFPPVALSSATPADGSAAHYYQPSVIGDDELLPPVTPSGAILTLKYALRAFFYTTPVFTISSRHSILNTSSLFTTFENLIVSAKRLLGVYNSPRCLPFIFKRIYRFRASKMKRDIDTAFPRRVAPHHHDTFHCREPIRKRYADNIAAHLAPELNDEDIFFASTHAMTPITAQHFNIYGILYRLGRSAASLSFSDYARRWFYL